MSFSPALVYDFIFLAVFSFAAVKSWQKGFLAGLTELIGAVLGVGIASWGSRTLAPEVYLSFFSDSVPTRVEQAVAQSGGDIAAAVQGLDFLPESIRAALAAGLQTAGDQLPEKINALLEPLFLPLVQAVLFVLLCMIVRWVFALLVRLLLWALPQEQTVFSTLAPRVVPMCRLPPDAAVVAAVFLCTLLYKGYKNIYNTI